MKTCRRCHASKPLTEYHRAATGADRLQSYCKQCRKEYAVANKASLLPTLRARAAKAGVPFSLTAASLPVVPALCPALGIPLVSTLGGASDGSPSLDRLIPSLGYVPGNVAWISFKANRIKNDSTLEELERVTRWTRESLSVQGAVPCVRQ